MGGIAESLRGFRYGLRLPLRGWEGALRELLSGICPSGSLANTLAPETESGVPVDRVQ